MPKNKKYEGIVTPKDPMKNTLKYNTMPDYNVYLQRTNSTLEQHIEQFQLDLCRRHQKALLRYAHLD